MTKRLLLLLPLACIAQAALAQLNESDTARLQVRVSLTGNYQQGNVAVTALRGRLDLVVWPVRALVFKSQHASLYQVFYDRKVDRDLFSRNYLYYHPERRVYPFGIAYVSTNYRRKIDWRFFAGAGLTGQLLNQPAHVLKVSAGAVYEETRFAALVYNESRYDGRASIALWRATFWVGGWHYLLANRLRLFYDAYYQPAFAQATNYRWQYDVGFDFPIWKGLAFSALYTYSHEHVVIRDIKSNDQMLTAGLAYTLRKLHRP